MFRRDKATQLAAYLIKRSGGRCNYLTLIKMMYDADRQMVLTWGTPIFFDKWVSMKGGPVLSATYDEIKGRAVIVQFDVVPDADLPNYPDIRGSGDDEPSYWSRYIATDGYDVVLKSDPGDDKLSDAELQMADKGFDDFHGLDYRAAIERAHDLFKEWVDPAPAKVKPISYSDVLCANDQYDTEYLNEVLAHCQVNEIFAR